MADNHILVSAGFDTAELDKQMKTFATKFRNALNSSLKNLKIDLSKLEGVKDITLKVKLDLSQAEKDLKAFQQKALNLPVVAVASKAATPKGTAAPSAPKPNAANLTLNPDQVADTAKRIDGLKNSLRLLGLSEKDVQAETGRLETKLRSVGNALDHMDQKARAFKNTTGRDLILNDKDVMRLAIAQEQLADINTQLGTFDKNAARANARTRDGSRFFQSFAFQVGILGFGLQTVGQRMIQVSEALFQITANAAKAIEPLQRIQNLLAQDPNLTDAQRTTIVDEINRLADIPGSNLEATADGFRKLNSIGLEMTQTLAILEGLIKATGRSGVGPEGVARLAQQFRQFASSGEFRQQDIRAIAESGGKDVTDIIERAFGSLDPEAIERAGPVKFFEVLIEGLKSIPAPLATATDKLNIMRNSLIRMAETLTDILMPGLDALAGVLKNTIEPLLQSIVAQFNKLSPEAKDFISTLLVALPVIATTLGTVLVGLGTLAIGISSLTQISKAWVAVTERMAIRAGVAGAEFSVLAASVDKLKAPFVFVIDFLNTIRAIGIGPVLKALTSNLSGLGLGLARIAGLTSPIGLFLNVLLGYLTNAQGSRNNINAAVVNLWESIKGLFSTLSELASGRLGSAIISTIGAIVDLLTGTLANALALLIKQLTQAVDLLNSLFEIANSPLSSQTWLNFGKNLAEALLGVIPRISAILAASIIDAFALAVDAMQKGAIGGQIGNTSGGNLIRQQAEKLRNSAFNKDLFGLVTDPFGVGSKQDTSLFTVAHRGVKQVNDEASKLNDTLKLTDALSKDIRKSFFDLGAKIADIDSDLRLAQQKFNFNERRKAIADQLARDIKADPTAALANIPKVFQSDLASANQLATKISSQEIKAASLGIAQTQENLRVTLQSLRALPGANAEAQESLNKAAEGMIRTGEQLTEFTAQGKTNYNEFVKLVNLYTEFGRALKGFAPQGEKGKEELRNLTKAVSETEGPITRALDAFKELMKARQDNQNQVKKEQEEAKRAAEDQERAKKAAEAEGPLRTQITGFEEEREQLTRDLQRTKNFNQQQNILNRIAQANAEINRLTAEIEQNRKGEADAVRDVNTQTEKTIDDQKNKNELSRQSLELLIQYNNQLTQSFREGFGALDEFRNKLLEIDSLRASLGLGPLTGRGGRLIQAGLAAQISPLLTENRQLGAANVIAPGSENDIERIVAALGAGVELSADLRNTLIAISEGSGRAVLDLTNRILANEAEIEKARDKIAGLGPGEERIAAEANLRTLLNLQAGLNTEANIYVNRVRAANLVLDANRKIITDKLRLQTELNARTRAELQQRQEIQQLEADLLSKQIENRNREAQGAGGLGAALDLRTADRLSTEELNKQIELLRTKHQLQVQELELRKLDLQAQLDAGDITQEQYEKQIELLNLRIDLLRQINEEEITGLSLDQANDSLQRFIGTIQSLQDLAVTEILKNFADGFKKATDDILNNFSILSSAATLFKDIFAAAFVSAFEAVGQAWVNFLTTGESFAKSFKKFLGDMLISIGTALIQMSLAAVAYAFLEGLFFGGIVGAFSQAAAVAPWAALGIAAGTALVVAGTLLGGGGQTSKTAAANATNSANSQTGATGDGFDPERDPKTLYQKAMATQVLIDVRTDDGVIVKKVIKAVNSNGRLANMIGNRKLGFGY